VNGVLSTIVDVLAGRSGTGPLANPGQG